MLYRRYLGRGHDKNAVFRGNHGMCRGVGDHIRQRGLAIPRFSVQAERYQSAAMKKACYYLRIRVPCTTTPIPLNQAPQLALECRPQLYFHENKHELLALQRVQGTVHL